MKHHLLMKEITLRDRDTAARNALRKILFELRGMLRVRRARKCILKSLVLMTMILPRTEAGYRIDVPRGSGFYRKRQYMSGYRRGDVIKTLDRLEKLGFFTKHSYRAGHYCTGYTPNESWFQFLSQFFSEDRLYSISYTINDTIKLRKYKGTNSKGEKIYDSIPFSKQDKSHPVYKEVKAVVDKYNDRLDDGWSMLKHDYKEAVKEVEWLSKYALSNVNLNRVVAIQNKKAIVHLTPSFTRVETKTFNLTGDEKKVIKGSAVPMQESNTVELLAPKLTSVFHVKQGTKAANFDAHGRYYHYLQNIPKKFRAKIKYAGQETIELDFTAAHISILYYVCGANKPTDVYSIEGYDRDTVKKAMLVAINAKSKEVGAKVLMDKRGKHHIPSIKTKKDAEKLIDALERKHKPISFHLFTGAGGVCMRIEARMIEYFLSNWDKPVLPIHDSVLVEKKEAAAAYKLLIEAWRKVMGNKLWDIDIKPEIKPETRPKIKMPKPKAKKQVRNDGKLFKETKKRYSGTSPIGDINIKTVAEYDKWCEKTVKPRYSKLYN